MAQFGGKIPPPWQTRPQANPIQNSLLGQHPSSGGPIPNQQIVIGAAPQTPQYAPVQQSMIQPPGLGGLQSISQPSIPQPHLAQHNLPQSICSSNLAQPGQQPTIAQVSLSQPICQGSSSLMGQPPLNSQNLAATSLVSHSQLVPSQMQQIQPQVTTVAYPTPRALAPPGSFSSQGAPVNLAASLTTNSMQAAAIVAAGPPSGSVVGSGGANQPPQKQRVFTGVITKLCADFGFVDEDVFFQTSCVKGPAPKVADRVLVEASYNSNMPFKWNANRVQVIPGSINSAASSSNRGAAPRESSRNVSFNAVPPPNFSSGNYNQSNSGFSGRSNLGPRARSPRRDRRDDGKRGSRDRPDRDDKEKDLKRENRKRSRSRDRSRSPARRRARVIPRYNVQVPKIMLHMKEANVLELRKRYSNLYVPSDVFLARPLWSETFPAHRAFQFPRPVAFHIMNKEVDPITTNDAVYDPPDINHSYAAKVMLMAVPPIEDIYRRSCALSEDPSDAKSCFVHPTRLINFLVGLKGKNETMAIGGYWSPSLDGQNPEKDPNVLIQTAIRTCKALTGIDLAGCTTWYRFAEIYYRRGESTHKGRVISARVETTVLFLPDVWNICPTKLEWDSLQLNYRRQLDRRLQSASGVQQPPPSQQVQQPSQQAQQQQQLEHEDQEEEEDGEDKEAAKKDPTHWASLDPKNMKVLELRSELDARVLNSKGLKSQLIARLTKALKVEQEKEEQEKAVADIMETDESQKQDEQEKRKEEEKKKKEEEEKKKEEEEKKRAEERERSLLEKRYTLPEQPMVIVHPSRTAKSGKFDCTTMSLSVLLDYRQEDNKEHSFEVSLFAELFNEMLMRDFSFKIYRALVEAPDKTKDEKREKEKEREKKDEKEDKEDEKKKKDEKETEEDKDDKKCEKKTEKDESKEDKEVKKEEFDEDEEMEEDFEEEMDDDDTKDGSKSSDKDKDGKDRDKDKKKDDRKDTRDNKREKKEKRKMATIDPHLLLSFVYFDQTHTGYIVDKDLEDIINILGMNLSRAQLKKLMTKVLSRDVLYYRKLTDLSVEERPKQTKENISQLDLELLAKGNNHLLPFFNEPANLTEKVRKSPRTPSKDEPVITSTGVVKYEGSLVDISKLMQQLERSERARSDTEERLKEIQKDLNVTKEESRKSSEKNIKSSKEIKSLQTNLKTMDEELKRVLEDNTVYQRALNQIKGVIRPLVAGVDLEDEDLTKEDVKIKVEGSKNGYGG